MRVFGRFLLAALLAFGLTAMTVEHRDESGTYPGSGGLEAHHHVPNAPCPDGVEHHCLACGAFSLFAPAPESGSLAGPAESRVVPVHAQGSNLVARRPLLGGRSPPPGILPVV